MRNILLTMVISIGCFVLSVCQNGFCEEPKTNALKEKKMNERVIDALKVQDESGQWPEEEVSLPQMLADRSEEVRREVCIAAVEYLKKGAGTASSRRKLVSDLAKSLADQSPVVRESVARLLSTLQANDFSPDAKISIQEAFETKPSKQLILLGGIADVDTVNKEVDKLVFQPSVKPSVGRFYGTLEWGAELVKARRGNPNNIKNVINAVEEEKSMVTRVGVLLQELEYVRQPEVIPILKKYLDSDERLEAVKPTVPGMKCAQYAAVVLARSVEGFPVIKEDLNYTEDELDICRKWMSAQTNWVFK